MRKTKARLKEGKIVKEQLFMLACHRFQGERSLFGAYHLLKGKRSAQTIQDGALFSALPLFGLLPQLSYNEAEQVVKALLENGKVRETDGAHQLTEKGETQLDAWLHAHSYVQNINNGLFQQADVLFWNRLALLVQSLNALATGTSFIPVVGDLDVQRFVKSTLPKPAERNRYRMKLYKECAAFLRKRDRLQAELFVLQLSRQKRIGETRQQLALRYRLSLMEVELRHKSNLHALMTETSENPCNYEVLSHLLPTIQSRTSTASARKTASLLPQVDSVQELAHIRGLKPATIEDHLVEIALFDRSFPIDRYVSEETQKNILRASREHRTLKLKTIRTALNNEVTYFDIRLTLARKGFIKC